MNLVDNPQEYSSKMGRRFPSMYTALSKLKGLSLRKNKHLIVLETGCMRGEDDWGAGMSTMLFCQFLESYPGSLFSVDIDEGNVKFATEQTQRWDSLRRVVAMDSVEYIKTAFTNDQDVPAHEFVIDLLYLDSMDYPLFELADLYGDRHQIDDCVKKMNELSTDDFVEKHLDIILPSQQHCLNELLTALPYLSRESVVLIDDSDFPGGGKPRLANQWLRTHGWTRHAQSDHQDLWTCV